MLEKDISKLINRKCISNGDINNSPVTVPDLAEGDSITMDYSSRVIPSTLHDNVGASDQQGIVMGTSIFPDPPNIAIRPVTTTNKLASATITSEVIEDNNKQVERQIKELELKIISVENNIKTEIQNLRDEMSNNIKTEIQNLRDEMSHKFDAIMQYELQLFNVMNQNIKSTVKEVIGNVLTGTLMPVQNTSQ